ncbi:MAG: hypothetical protein PHC34_07350 [Candidatus Gastranaerophilales bacterium]|nr:hypothetical protein [Candidatus Gastranaerophilales bacterium]
MPLDGLSFSNSGMYRITAPMEVTDQVKQFSEIQAQNTIKKPEEADKLKADLENDKDQHKDLQGRETGDDSQEEEQEKENFTDRNKYKVRFNQKTDMVELIDQKTGFILETISSIDLVNLVSKSNGSSGVFVDEKI